MHFFLGMTVSFYILDQNVEVSLSNLNHRPVLLIQQKIVFLKNPLEITKEIHKCPFQFGLNTNVEDTRKQDTSVMTNITKPQSS